MSSGWPDISRESGKEVARYGLAVGLLGIVVLAVLIALGPHLNRLIEHSVSAESYGHRSGQSSEARY